MTEVLFPYQKIRPLIDRLRKARLEELEAARTSAQARHDYEAAKATVIATAYDDGEIDGRNKQIRDAQEDALVANHPALERGREAMAEAERAAEVAKLDRLALEDEVSLTRAWLYSQSGVGRG